MLGKQRKINKVDQQFMDTAWKNMAEILDQEMPVETKERRIGWISIAALLVMGFVGGISAMWGLQKHQPTSIASNHSIHTTNEANIISTPVDENELITNASQNQENHSLTANNSRTTINKITNTTSNNTNKTPILATTIVKEVPTKKTITTEIFLASADQSEKSIVEDIPTIITAIETTTLENADASVSVIAMEMADEIDNASLPLAELPTLGLTNLPTVNTNFSIDHDLDLPKNKKWQTGVYAGAIIAGKTGNGLEAAFKAERKLGAKWGVETGLGFRATQLAFLSENINTDHLFLSDRDFQNIPNAINGDTLGSSFNSADRARIVNENAPDYHLTVPLSLIYRPTGKLRLALGMSWAFRLNKLKNASSFNRNELLTDTDLEKNSFSNRINDMRWNFGVGYYLNPRTAIELAFSQAVTFNGFQADEFSDASRAASEGESPIEFVQLGLTHYFGK